MGRLNNEFLTVSKFDKKYKVFYFENKPIKVDTVSYKIISFITSDITTEHYNILAENEKEEYDEED